MAAGEQKAVQEGLQSLEPRPPDPELNELIERES